jgi:UDP-2-acetamido-2,6-beta-L-arabino-hexul-4-ose reductase
MTATGPVPPRIAITGGFGFLGWHLRCAIRMHGGYEAVAIGRDMFTDVATLAAAVRGADAVVHLAAVNRGEQADVERENPRLARMLAEALRSLGATPHVVFANSTHSRDPQAQAPVPALTPYGRAKREAAAILGEWAAAAGARFTDIRFPHLFGECGRPFYNSAIATFCHQLAVGDTPAIQVDAELELVHAQRACDLILDAIEHGRTGGVSPSGERMRVSEALERLQRMSAVYQDGTLPQFTSAFELELFNTLRACRFPAHYPGRLQVRSDARGRLFEAVRSHHEGQCFASWTVPGAVRGNHFHRRKIERFLVTSGEARIRVRRLFSDEVHVFDVRGDIPVFIDMPTLHTHDIRNTGSSELFTLFWSHEMFDPQAPDTYAEAV